MVQVTVFGANGSSGQEICKYCIGKGWKVIAAVRRPETMVGFAGVEVRKISFDDGISMEKGVSGSDAVVMATGSGGVVAARKYTTVYSDGVRSVRRAMEAQGIKRLLVLSSAGIDYDRQAPWMFNRVFRLFLMNMMIDVARMETILAEDDNLDWTVVRLPALSKGASKPYKTAELYHPKGSKYEIHHVDVGKFIGDEIANEEFIRKFPAPSY
ncbi:hypothetical protein NDN08_007078 [Rhodosorus marinus]|uniref:NAD(P)-binding domain-containing protein n=1 Tax=Rhodosorus marinus TaxID=101924 RepID=A0AAV8UIY7_9RHOD|nr:hypothetical protein NDN08_007076 [Rhodosorus marinus]KAJ8901228.1 hypothetical protein NDN08_007077 [Rhodosorus marinus]KAJ8901229.1 hypothetical protein NDN08_007078 [Rhodosorus marinus]